jgi:hypothetical protein
VTLVVHEDEQDVAGFLSGVGETTEEEKQTAEERGGEEMGWVMLRVFNAVSGIRVWADRSVCLTVAGLILIGVHLCLSAVKVSVDAGAVAVHGRISLG